MTIFQKVCNAVEDEIARESCDVIFTKLLRIQIDSESAIHSEFISTFARAQICLYISASIVGY